MKRPIHTQKPGVGSSHGGWRQPVEDLWTQLLAEVHSLKARAAAEVEGPIGVPAAYTGARIFTPSTHQITVANPAGGTFAVHPIVQDGQTYDIPIYFPGPGVFVARTIEVNVYHRLVTRLYSGRVPVASGLTMEQRMLVQQHSTALAASAAEDGSIRTHRYSFVSFGEPAVPGPPVDGAAFPVDEWEPITALQYWWNLVDTKSQRFLADNLMPQQILQPMTSPRRVTTPTNADGADQLGYPLDGGRFYFDAPWLVERDGQMRFQFRPTTSIYQRVASHTSLAEGAEAQDVTVQVELYGERYETLQDAVRSGAMTRPVRAEEE